MKQKKKDEKESIIWRTLAYLKPKKTLKITWPTTTSMTQEKNKGIFWEAEADILRDELQRVLRDRTN